MKLRITVTIPDECPEGTGLLFALAELIKFAPNIVGLEKGERYRTVAFMGQGDVIENVSMIDV